MGVPRTANVKKVNCVTCGTCEKVCPKGAIVIFKGCFAKVESKDCVACGKCMRSCPTGCISIKD